MTYYDVLVIGAGILGLSTAYHIKLANPTLKVLVVEKNVAAGLGSTLNSAAAFRVFFSSQTNLALADSSIKFYKHLQDDLGIDLKMHWCGYLWSFTQDDYQQILPILKELKTKDLDYKEYSPEEINQILGMQVNFTTDPKARQLGLGDIYRAIFIPQAGLIGVVSLVHFYEKEFIKLGGEIQYRTKVLKLIVEKSVPEKESESPCFLQNCTIGGAETENRIIKSKKTIVATGAWLPQLLDPVGIECFVKAKKRQVFTIKADTEKLRKLLHTNNFSKDKSLPFIILPKPSIYLRPNLDDEGFGVGYADEFPRAFLIEDHPKPEVAFFKNGLSPIIASYLPQFEGSPTSGGFAGLYEINTLDAQPIIFEEHNLIVVGGGSGSGIMKADAIGRIAAATYKGQETVQLFGGTIFFTSDVGLTKRRVEHEKLII